MARITPHPGHEPNPMPPIGAKWIHIGEGAFVPAKDYKAMHKEGETDRHWSDDEPM